MAANSYIADRLDAMCDQVGHPDYSLHEFVTGVRLAAKELRSDGPSHRSEIGAQTQSWHENAQDGHGDKRQRPSLDEQVAWLEATARGHAEDIKQRGDQPGPGTAMIEAILATVRSARSAIEPTGAKLDAICDAIFGIDWRGDDPSIKESCLREAREIYEIAVGRSDSGGDRG